MNIIPIYLKRRNAEKPCCLFVVYESFLQQLPNIFIIQCIFNIMKGLHLKNDLFKFLA